MASFKTASWVAGTAAALFSASAIAQPAESSNPPAQSAIPRQVPLAGQTEEVTITARRREENAQAVPVAVSVVGTQMLEATGTYNVGQLAQLVPSVQFFSSNPRNTAITIRGLGTSFGLTNDGLESGVGLYVDQVYMSRPAAATFDFVDVEQIEVLRGPQGTLFGKNTTAGAINITTKIPTFDHQTQAEVSAGNYGFWQGKASISGPLAGNVLAGRLAVVGRLRDGTLHNVTTDKDINNQNDIGLRAQLLYLPDAQFRIRLVGDYNHQQTQCCAQVFVGFGPTLKPASQQFPALAAAVGYAPASLNPYDRLADSNTRAQANQTIGGISAIADWDLGPVTLTSVSAWRNWNWDPSNDRDFTKLSVQTASINPDNQNQYSQELRVASNGQQTVDYVAGVYYYRQKIDARPVAQYGADATRWLLPQDLSLPANLLDGYRSNGEAHSDTKSYAAFAQATWNITDALHLTPGLRYTYEDKFGSYDQVASGGLPPANANQLTRKTSIVRNQSYAARFNDSSVSGQLNLAYDVTDDVLAYATYSRGYKSGGINLAGIPTDAAGNPVFTTAVIKPERLDAYEIGLKNRFLGGRVILNLAAFITKVHDYQVNVVDSGPGALRGYLSNIEKVSSRGFEWDSAFAPTDNLTGYFSAAWTQGRYDSFANGPCPLELIGTATTACDLSGRPLAGLSKWVFSGGGEYHWPAFSGTAYAGIDASYRSPAYSDASDSRYLRIPGYGLVNARLGFISAGAWEAFLWAKNIFDQNYFQYISVQPGNSGMLAGLPGDPRTFGVTLRVRY